MKKIGLVDYFIDEWHSNNYIVWVKEICEKYGLDFEIKYAWAETDTYDGKMPTDEWCNQNNIEKCDTIDELCEKSDYIMILSPAHPEKHLKYAETVLKYGKNTYIDKTFAVCKAEAEKIYEIGEKYNTKFFSTSALRYADELEEYKDGIKSMMVMGGGRSFDVYVIHQIEMMVKLMGIGAERVKVFACGGQRECIVEYGDGRCGFIEYSASDPFTVTAEDKNGKNTRRNIESEFFKNLLYRILKFFGDGILPFEKEQTMEVMGIRDALIKAESHTDEWINVD